MSRKKQATLDDVVSGYVSEEDEDYVPGKTNEDRKIVIESLLYHRLAYKLRQ